MENKRSLSIRINDSVPGALHATLRQARVTPFAALKPAQPVPEKLALKANVKRNKGEKMAAIEFSAQQMARLTSGLYIFEIQAAPSGKFKGFGPLALATIQITDATATPAEWTIPASLRVSVGQQYQLVKLIPGGGALPELTVKSGDKKIATIGSDGVLSAKKSGATTITVRGADGEMLKCKLTVVANSYSRSKPLYVKGKPGLYTSMKRLYYEKGRLKAEVFALNTTGATIRGADGWVFELYDGETLVQQLPLGPLTFTLKNKRYAACKLSITDETLPGVGAKAFDLGSKRYRAVIRGGGATALIASMGGVVQAQSGAFQSSASIQMGQ